MANGVSVKKNEDISYTARMVTKTNKSPYVDEMEIEFTVAEELAQAKADAIREVKELYTESDYIESSKDYKNILANNTFENNKINLTHQDWSKSGENAASPNPQPGILEARTEYYFTS